MKKSIQKALDTINIATDGYWVLIQKNKQVFMEFSPSFLSKLGYQENEISNDVTSWHTKIHKSNITEFESFLKNIQNKKKEKINIKIKQKNGSYASVILNSCFEKEVIFGSTTITNDTNSTEYSHEILMESIVENIPNMIFVKDAKELRFELFNKAGETLLGLDREELLGKNDYDFFPEDQAKHFQEKDRKVLESQKLELIEKEPLETKNGSQWLRTKKVPILNEKGEPVHLLGISENITQQIKQNEKIEKQSNFLRNTIDQLPAIFYAKETNGKYLAINNIYKQLFSLESAQIIGKTDHDIFPKDIADTFRKNDQSIIETKKLIECEETITDHQGTERIYNSLRFPYTNENGEVYAIGGVSIDITEKKALEKHALHNSKLASIGEMAAGIGHEINNPLTIIISHIKKIIEKLRKNELDHGELLEKLNSVKGASILIAHIVTGLKSFSRIDNEEKNIFPITNLLLETVLMLKEIYENDGIKILHNLESINKPVSIYGNRGKIQQVILNLLSNAKDASINSKEKEISIYVELDNDTFTLKIKDKGAGIKKELMEKVFDPFFTTKEVGKGTGIGLSLVHNIIEDHDGKINLESKENQGACFTICFPTKSAIVKEHKVQTQTKNFKISSKNILVVDDEIEIREILEDALKDAGHNVVACENGKLALNEIINNPQKFDLVISDFKMPIMSGKELLQNIRANANIRQPFFIIITAGSNIDINENLEKSIDAYIYKPFDEDKITETIDSIFHKEQKRAA